MPWIGRDNLLFLVDLGYIDLLSVPNQNKEVPNLPTHFEV